MYNISNEIVLKRYVPISKISMKVAFFISRTSSRYNLMLEMHDWLENGLRT